MLGIPGAEAAGRDDGLGVDEAAHQLGVKAQLLGQAGAERAKLLAGCRPGGQGQRCTEWEAACQADGSLVQGTASTRDAGQSLAQGASGKGRRQGREPP